MNEPKLQDEIEANKAAPDEAKAKPKKEKPPKRGENPEEIAKLLKDIEKAEKEVQVAEIELDSRKEAAKAAKAEWLVKVSALRECVRTRERWNEESKRQPLLNQKHDKPDNRMKLPYDAKETKSIGILSDIKQSNGLLLTGQGDRHTGYIDADGYMFLVIDGNRFEPHPDDYAILEESTPAASNGEWRQLAIDNLAGEVTVKEVMNVVLNIPGEPISQPRQRHALIGGHVRNYTPAKAPVNAYKYAIQCKATEQFSGEPTTHPIHVDIVCVFSRPKSHYRTGKMADQRKVGSPNCHTTKPDAENVAKAIMDALTGIAYRDDKQVCDLSVTKRYTNEDEQPRTLIGISYDVEKI